MTGVTAPVGELFQVTVDQAFNSVSKKAIFYVIYHKSNTICVRRGNQFFPCNPFTGYIANKPFCKVSKADAIFVKQLTKEEIADAEARAFFTPDSNSSKLKDK